MQRRNKNSRSPKRKVLGAKPRPKNLTVENDAWNEIEKAFRERISLKGCIMNSVKGGLHVGINGVAAFLPKDQFGNASDRNLNHYRNQIIEVIITKISRTDSEVFISRALISRNDEIKPLNMHLSAKAGKAIATKNLLNHGDDRGDKSGLHLKLCKLCPKRKNFIEEHEYEYHVTVYHQAKICPSCNDAVTVQGFKNHTYRHKRKRREFKINPKPVQGGLPTLGKRR
jgi:hypothetical protein